MAGRLSGDKGGGGRSESVSCWFSCRLFRSCSFSRSKPDSCTSGTSTNHAERNFTNDTSKDQPCLYKFTFKDLKLATGNFRHENLLGEGNYGRVSKGWIGKNGTGPAKPSTGLPVAVKNLYYGLESKREWRLSPDEWLAEINFLSGLVHPNLVKLIGYCIEDDQRLLISEFIPKGSLENHLNGRTPLPWSIRMKIALGAARALAFLHDNMEGPIIYYDFKTSKILLDADYNVKLSDFGLSKYFIESDQHHAVLNKIHGYYAPEFIHTGHRTLYSNVYCFGVVLLELLTGRRAMDSNLPLEQCNLVVWARPHLYNRRGFNRLMDPWLEGQFPTEGAKDAVQLAALCLVDKPRDRPRMSQVAETLSLIVSLHTDHTRIGTTPNASKG